MLRFISLVALYLFLWYSCLNLHISGHIRWSGRVSIAEFLGWVVKTVWVALGKAYNSFTAFLHSFRPTVVRVVNEKCDCVHFCVTPVQVCQQLLFWLEIFVSGAFRSQPALTLFLLMILREVKGDYSVDDSDLILRWT